MPDKELSGAELDRAIAERIMGWKPVEGQTALAPFAYKRPDGHIVHPYSAPKYSESIEAAMQVVEKMREQHWCIDMMNQFSKGPQWAVSFEGVEGNDIREAFAADDCLPTAICIAALKALESKQS